MAEWLFSNRAIENLVNLNGGTAVSFGALFEALCASKGFVVRHHFIDDLYPKDPEKLIKAIRKLKLGAKRFRALTLPTALGSANAFAFEIAEPFPALIAGYLGDTAHVHVVWAEEPDGEDRMGPTLEVLQPLLELFQSAPPVDYAKQFQSRIYVLTKSLQGFRITELGAFPTPLERGNYTKVVLDGYDTVVRELSSHTPSGRLAIFNGPPGSGKSFVVRGLIHEAKNALFLLVPTGMAESMGSPELLPTLLNFDAVVPMVLVIEDADALLAPRVASNMGAISALLNMGDGILGGVLDLRIIATTNSPTQQFDPAVLRPGRLLANVDVQALKGADVARVGMRLVPSTKPEEWPEEATLAEIYKLARDRGWKPPIDKAFDLRPRDYERQQEARAQAKSVETFIPEDSAQPKLLRN